ncbi:MAG: hypothetical protein KBS46_01165 [Clostridiales bacterium]|nr:hypothetical protein [Candidatus Apopatocola equi]
MAYPDELFARLKPSYTPEEAKERIDTILEPFGENCRIQFRKTDAEIIDSYLVDSQTLRHLICEIIHRTGLTERSYENLAAEWMVHNVSYDAGVFRADAKDVSLDYNKDPRAAVKLATEVFDILNIE